MDSFDEFLYSCISPFYSVQVHFESTTVALDSPEKFLDTPVSPFSSVHFPSRYIIACFEKYPQPSSICQTYVNSLLYQMVDDYCTTIIYSFPPALLCMILSTLILGSLLLKTFALRFSHGLTSVSLLLFQVLLYLYLHAGIEGL